MTKETDLEKLIEQAMIVMVVEFHTLAYMISKIGIEVVDNPSIPAAAYTNGQGIYINKYAGDIEDIFEQERILKLVIKKCKEDIRIENIEMEPNN